jgi:hypothetical protein
MPRGVTRPMFHDRPRPVALGDVGEHNGVTLRHRDDACETWVCPMHMVRWVFSRHGGGVGARASVFLVLLQERGGYGQQHLLGGRAHSEVRGRDGPPLRPFSGVLRVLLRDGGGLVLSGAS